MAVGKPATTEVVGVERRVLKAAAAGKRKQPASRILVCPASDASTATGGSASHLSRCSSLDEERFTLRQRVSEAALLPVRFPHEENAAVYLTMAARCFARAPPVASNARFSCFRSEGEYELVSRHLPEKLGTHFKPQKPAYIFALSYLQRLEQLAPRVGLPFSPDTFVRLVCGCLMVATKFFDDIYNTNTYYSAVLNLDVRVFNQMERELLWLLNFDASLDSMTYRDIDELFEVSRYRVCTQASRPVLCGDYTLPISPEILLYANTYGYEKTVTRCGTTADDFLTMDLQDSLIARRLGNCKFQTECERLLAQSVRQRTDHTIHLLNQAEADLKAALRGKRAAAAKASALPRC